MRASTIIGRRHDETKFEVIAGPNTSYDDKRSIMKSLQTDRVNHVWAEIHFYEVPEKTLRLRAPAVAKDGLLQKLQSLVTAEKAPEPPKISTPADLGYTDTEGDESGSDLLDTTPTEPSEESTPKVKPPSPRPVTGRKNRRFFRR